MPSKTPLRMSPLTPAEKKVGYDKLPTHRQIAMLEWCLWKLATIIDARKDGRKLIPLYEKLENAMIELQAQESTMHRIMARLNENKKP